MINKLKQARFFAGMSQIRLAQRSGIHASTISRLENGFFLPSEVQKQKLAEALDVDVDSLFPKSD